MGEASKLSWNIADPPQSRDANGRTESSGSVKKSNATRAKSSGDDANKHGTHGPSSSRSASDGGGAGEGVGATSSSGPPDNEAQGEKPPTVGPDGTPNDPPKASIITRMKNGSIRFGVHTKDALFNSWINVLLVFVPLGIAVNFAGLNPVIIFAMNAVAIVPLAGMLSYATETVASRLGETLAALLNVSFGNAVELIIFIIALSKDEIQITQAAILGSILANLLLILGMAFFFGGLRFQEQIYNSTITQMSACLLSLSVMSLLLPTAFHASFSDNDTANTATLKVSRGTSVILLLIYVLFLVFQLKSHAYLYKATPQQIIDEESHPGVLHDVLNSSTSSSSSDTDGESDSSSSSASHHTGMRIKRAFRRRRRFSVSSKDTPRSGISSPPPEQDNFDPTISRRPSTINPVLEGDDADADDEKPRRVNSTLQFSVPEGEAAPPAEKKHKRRHKKRHHRRRRTQSSSRKDAGEITPAAPRSTAPSIKDVQQQQQQQKVEFADEKGEERRIADEQEAEEMRVEAVRAKIQSRNMFNMRVNRPALPKMLSNNVFTAAPPGFVSPAPAPPPIKPSVTRTVAMGPRRVRSLPDRMNTAQALSALAAVPSRGSATAAVPAHNTAAEHESDDDDEEPTMSRTAAVMLLLCSTALVALCAEFMVDAIPHLTQNTSVSQTFIGLIILPIVGNAAEHVTAVSMAFKNKVDLAIGVSVGSSIQIALFVTPFVVLLGWIMDREMSLFFNLFETISLFVTAFVVNFLVLDGRSNYLEGALLMGAYIIIAVASFFYPDGSDQSALGGNGTDGASGDAAKRMVAVLFHG